MDSRAAASTASRRRGLAKTPSPRRRPLHLSTDDDAPTTTLELIATNAGRLDAVEVKLGKQGGEAGKKALAKAKKAYGKALDALKKQREVVDGWLSPK